MLEIDVTKRHGAFTAQVAFTSTTPGVTALFGRSGCGKTTTINMIAGLLRPDRGHIRIDGTVLFDAARGIDVPVQDRGIGYIFQGLAAVSASVGARQLALRRTALARARPQRAA